jgi:hypothetical protein
VNLLVRVQHAKGRTEPLNRLLPGLIPLAVQVVEDPETTDPNPLRNYVRCLADPPPGVTHMAVLQDDCVPCKNFDITLRNAVGERPDDLISLFVGGLPGKSRVDFLRALKRRERWSPIYMPGITHVVAMVWPVAAAAEFLGWFPPPYKIPGTREPYRSDDMVVGYWARVTKRQIWATVPCLVEHPDDVPSVAQSDRGGDGLDRGRRAIHFVDS